MDAEKLLSGIGIVLIGMASIFYRSSFPGDTASFAWSFGWLALFLGLLIAAWGYLDYG